MRESKETGSELELDESRIEELDDGIEALRLGHDVRFVLVAVGGGAVRIGRDIARRHVRHLETIAVNCDARVQDLDEFDRRVFLGPSSSSGDGTAGSPTVGGRLAQAAEPALDRLFKGATFVTIVASLGGGTGTGALPFLVEAASRTAEFVSVFVVKPFSCEGDRRAIADRALARLHFVESFVEKQENRRATLTVLDNQGLAATERGLPFGKVTAHWAELIATHVEHSFIAPIEAAVEARRLERVVEAEPLRAPGPIPPPPLAVQPPEPALGPIPLAPTMDSGDAELTFEVFNSPSTPPTL